MEQFLDQGVLGGVVITCFVVIRYLYKENKELQSKRISDIKEIGEKALDPIREFIKMRPEVQKVLKITGRKK